MFFEGTPDFYALPVEYGLPFLFAAMTYLSHRHRESSSPAPHECPTCRYNLTGNTSGICPECGNSISTSSASPATLPPTFLPSPVIVYRPADDGRVTPHLIVGCTGSQCLTLIGSEHILPTRV